MKRTLTVLLLLISFGGFTQDLPFWNEIKAFKAEDSLHAPPKHPVVFVGSSSFKMWRDLQQSFPGHKVINRGFGGSSLPHVILYADQIILPYKPKQVVIYCGDNDLMNSTANSDTVAARFEKLFYHIRKKLRDTNIVFVSIKPSPSRQHLMPEMAKANQSIKEFLKTKRRTVFVNIWDEMLNDKGEPRRELFLEDMLHMNKQGYAIWQRALEPVLK
jgi:lysophospholipase L1-like esterase